MKETVVPPSSRSSRSPIEFRLLALLARFRGATVTLDQLLNEIWRGGADQPMLAIGFGTSDRDRATTLAAMPFAG